VKGSRSGNRWIPVGAFALATVLYGGLVLLGTTRPSAFEMDPFDLSDALFVTAVYSFAVMGALVGTKRPGHRMGSIFLATGLLALLSYGSFEYSIAALYGPYRLPLGDEVAWFGTWGWIPMIGGFALVLLTYPTGRFLSPRWGLPLVLVCAGAAVALVGSLGFWPHRGGLLLEVTTSEALPRVAGVPDLSHTLLAVASPIVLFAFLLSILSVMVRFRRSRDIERQQMKGLLYATILLISAGAVDLIAPQILGSGYTSTFDVLAPAGLLAVPLAAGVAVLRYRLYDIDLVINRTIVYGGLTAILVGLYLGTVFVLQQLLAGVTKDSDIAVAGSTLLVAAAFRPLRVRVQGFIDRRFYRNKYNAQLTLENFSSRLRDDVDLEHLAFDLAGVVQDTMQPTHVSVWLRTARP